MDSASRSNLVSLNEIRSAEERLRGVAVHTPLVRMDYFSGAGELWLKAENLQPIGSFKLRGAYNRIAQLSPEERSRGVITYSSGNHAQGVAYAARALGMQAVIVMPSNTPEVKRRATAKLGAEIVTVGVASSERRLKAEMLSAEFGYIIIPPYDDAAIIAGQATCGMEILADMPDLDLVLASVSGGGLLSGVAAAVKLTRPDIKVIGVEPELAGDAEESFASGSIAHWPAELTSRTIADGMRTESVGVLNFAHMQAFVDDVVTVSEDQIRRAMIAILFGSRLLAEPSGAVTTAAAFYCSEKLPKFRKAVAILSGGNVDPHLLREIL